jgi:cytochrome P450
MSGPGRASSDGSSPAEGEAITGLAWSADDRQFLEDPSDYYRWLRDEEPVHYHEPSGSFFLSRFEDVWQATADWQTFSSQSPVSRLRHMASMDPPDHDRLRASVVRHFAPHRIARLEPRIRAICRELLDPLTRESSFDLVARFTTLFPSFVINRLMGVPPELDEKIREIALGIGAAQDTEMLGRLMDELAELTIRVVEGDPAPAEPGLIQMLQREEGASGLDREDLRGICSNLVLAGTDTVTNLVGNGVVLLARRPAERERLLRDPGLIRRGVEEMLRFESPVQSLARRVTRNVTLHGVALPEGAEVRLQWGAANRDEREFERPDAFDVGREIRRHLALGHGRHFCLGAHLARLEARVALEELLKRWPALDVDESRLERLPSLWVRAWSQIVLVADSDAA